jgi:hypothetical protein
MAKLILSALLRPRREGVEAKIAEFPDIKVSAWSIGVALARLREAIMQTYVAEIDGRAIFAFRADNVGCAQAWLDIHAVMRHALETIHSDGRRIWNGRAPIARNATSAEATIWSDLSDEVAGDRQTTGGVGEFPLKPTSRSPRDAALIQQNQIVLVRTRRL